MRRSPKRPRAQRPASLPRVNVWTGMWCACRCKARPVYPVRQARSVRFPSWTDSLEPTQPRWVTGDGSTAAPSPNSRAAPDTNPPPRKNIPVSFPPPGTERGRSRGTPSLAAAAQAPPPPPESASRRPPLRVRPSPRVRPSTCPPPLSPAGFLRRRTGTPRALAGSTCALGSRSAGAAAAAQALSELRGAAVEEQARYLLPARRGPFGSALCRHSLPLQGKSCQGTGRPQPRSSPPAPPPCYRLLLWPAPFSAQPTPPPTAHRPAPHSRAATSPPRSFFVLPFPSAAERDPGGGSARGSLRWRGHAALGRDPRASLHRLWSGRHGPSAEAGSSPRPSTPCPDPAEIGGHWRCPGSSGVGPVEVRVGQLIVLPLLKCRPRLLQLPGVSSRWDKSSSWGSTRAEQAALRHRRGAEGTARKIFIPAGAAARVRNLLPLLSWSSGEERWVAFPSCRTVAVKKTG